jgi:hypothetical protein
MPCSHLDEVCFRCWSAGVEGGERLRKRISGQECTVCRGLVYDFYVNKYW